jgi:hypothetical protein
VFFVVHEDRRPNVLAEVQDVDSGDGQVAGGVDCCGVREESEREGAVIQRRGMFGV